MCLSVEMPGCAPHELLCIHPTVLLEKHANSVPWDDVDGVLRGFLLQMHSLQYAMPEAVEGMPCLKVSRVIVCHSTCVRVIQVTACLLTVVDLLLNETLY